ncbi:MAG: GatB/YqeY domain-containing protein [Bacteroidales bacterium]|jgi:uncharacterized protein YqeY|nr:GatB/YqeY domain-containing protein [Bacteroidales bacterium]MCK9500129.1 GatB/YqeY domain-containing protein [Bacteroidales bacterium]MDY0315862.1 GatB/YqeY domain-containing protein [Bacteroidales bacterium]NLB85663.1 GatB/YqeY domain-containing protein [Bacteroidales bacterium]
MSILDKINEDIKKAMLAKEKEKLEALRAVKAAFLLAKTENSAKENLSYEKELQIIQKLIKQRKDAAEIYKQQNRMDLFEPEEFQAEIISSYLPAQLSAEELNLEISKIIEQTGASTIKDMGKVMGIANSKLVGKADSKSISAIVKQLLTK